jgi:hypothetical protein
VAHVGKEISLCPAGVIRGFLRDLYVGYVRAGYYVTVSVAVFIKKIL